MSAANRYRAGKHDTAVECPSNNCTARNAPPESEDYRDTCWRCNTPLEATHEVGDVYEVDIVDETDEGRAVAKTRGGFVIFLDTDTSAISAQVKLTDVEDNHGEGTIVENADTASSAEEEDSSPKALGRRGDFWEDG